MYNSIVIEEQNTPVAVLVNRDFMADARSAASGRGWPGIRSISENVPCECTVPEQIEAGIEETMDDIVSALTTPLTEEEKSPKPKVMEKPSRIVFQGDLEEVNRFFYRRGWTDGLPVIPPTEQAVAEMLTGTDLPPDHVVTKIVPRSGKATVEKIAVNAVMAGALPTYMPLLIAGVKAVMEPRAFFGTYEVSTGSWAPCLLVNGPISKALNINCSSGVMSPGNVANAGIGRAMGLVIKNIGGARTGIEDMGVMGNPMKYSLVLAENEDHSPWEPLHVQHGLNQEDSAVTIFFPNTLLQIQAYGSDDDTILRSVIYNVPPAKRGLTCILMIPPHAKRLAGKGWTKKDVTAFISEYARAPKYHHQEYWGSFARTAEEQGMGLFLSPKDSPDESIAIFRDPEWLRVFVTGGPGSFISMLMGGLTVGPTGWVTQKVDLPPHWAQLVEKYKNLVPRHIKY